MKKIIALVSGFGVTLASTVFAAADASMTTASEGIATSFKENITAALTSSTFLTALAIVVALLAVIGLSMRLFKRGAR